MKGASSTEGNQDDERAGALALGGRQAVRVVGRKHPATTRRLLTGQKQVLLTGVWQQNGRERAQFETREVPTGYKEKLFTMRIARHQNLENRQIWKKFIPTNLIFSHTQLIFLMYLSS